MNFLYLLLSGNYAADRSPDDFSHPWDFFKRITHPLIARIVRWGRALVGYVCNGNSHFRRRAYIRKKIPIFLRKCKGKGCVCKLELINF